MDLRVSGRPYLLVGGTAGMGLATASLLAAEGARVGIVGRDAARAATVAESLGAQHGAQVLSFAADVSQPGQAADLVDRAAAALGGLAGVAVTTGMTGHHPPGADDATWTAVFQDVFMGTVRTVDAAVPHLVAGGGGTVVTTAAYSIHAYHPVRVPYVSMKAAVAAFTKTIAKAYGGQGVRANCVCPGAIETGRLAALREQRAEQLGIPPEGIIERMMKEELHMDVALGRPGRAEEVGELYAFLLSPLAGYLTGAVINIDGGTDF